MHERKQRSVWSCSKGVWLFEKSDKARVWWCKKPNLAKREEEKYKLDSNEAKCLVFFIPCLHTL